MPPESIPYMAGLPALGVVLEGGQQNAELDAGLGQTGQLPGLAGEVGSGGKRLVEQPGGVEAEERNEGGVTAATSHFHSRRSKPTAAYLA